MALKIIRAELLESNVIVELEAEETMNFQNIISKLKTEEHLKPEVSYFIKTAAGGNVKANTAIADCKQNYFVITENTDWKCPALKNGTLADVPEIQSELMINDNKYWILPYGGNVEWDREDLQAQLYCLDNISNSSSGKMSINVIVQFYLSETALVGNKKTHERAVKMKQILEDALSIEMAVSNITEDSFYGSMENLSEKLKHYLMSHMETQWGTIIHSVSIVGFREYE